MKNMKIRVIDANRTDVRKALEREGYKFYDTVSNVYETAYAYFTETDGYVTHLQDTGADIAYFNNSKIEEYILFSGEFKPVSYFTQPKTPEQKPAERPPLGLRPRHVVLRERNKEISEAILRYVEAGKKVPQEWIEELSQNIGEME